MKKLMAIAGLLAVMWQATPSEQLPDTNQEARSFERTITKTVGAQYLLFLPKDYDTDRSKRWPLILFLHGAGERGTNLAKVMVHGPPKIVKEKPEFPFIVASPQCPPGQTWSNDVVIALLNELTEKLRVDTKRVYLTGLSMGGYGTWSLAAAHPERFAAVVPICGGGDPIRIRLVDKQNSEALRTLPVWAFHGAKDTVVRPAESERMVEALRRIGNEAKLTIYEDAEHDSWTRTYANPELYDWLLKHHR